MHRGDDEVVLTRTEFDLLRTLLESQRRPRSKEDLALVARGDAPDAAYVSDLDKRAIEAHITNLRRKLGDPATDPRYIETVRGVGYRLTVEDRRSDDLTCDRRPADAERRRSRCGPLAVRDAAAPHYSLARSRSIWLWQLSLAAGVVTIAADRLDHHARDVLVAAVRGRSTRDHRD